MLKEELRTHTTYSGTWRFFSFPFMVFIFCFIIALFMERLLEEISLEELGIMSQASAFLYGLAVGSFGFLGRQYIERKYGKKNYIVASPALLPITYRRTFFGLYVRDSIFYLALVLLPATAGLVVSSVITDFNIVSILLFFVAAILSFQLGTSLSFLGSVIYNRSLAVFILFTTGIVILVMIGALTSLFEVELVVPSIGFQLSIPPFGDDIGVAGQLSLLSIFMILAMVLLSMALIAFHPIIRTARFPSLLPRYIERFTISGGYKELVGKEFLDLRRSGTIGKMVFSFVLPLVFLSFTSWFVNTGLGIEVGFNSVFYGAMIGFLGILLYSWLNNVDNSDYYSLLPITVPAIIRTRLLLFLILTTGISAAFVVAISLVNEELDILWLALIVMFVTSIYMVVMTAYLTGIRTNTFLFDMDILGRFAVMSFLPDVCLVILSFTIRSDPVFAFLAIASVLLIMSCATVILYRGIDSKWRGTSFDA